MQISYEAKSYGGYVVSDDNENNTVYFQTDWDFPGLASTFGWRPKTRKGCKHDGTDGTVDCRDCGKTASEFIDEAITWLDNHEGKNVEDPGYFDYE